MSKKEICLYLVLECCSDDVICKMLTLCKTFAACKCQCPALLRNIQQSHVVSQQEFKPVWIHLRWKLTMLYEIEAFMEYVMITVLLCELNGCAAEPQPNPIATVGECQHQVLSAKSECASALTARRRPARSPLLSLPARSSAFHNIHAAKRGVICK